VTEPIRYSPEDEPSRYLARRDPRLRRLMERIGPVEFTRINFADRFSMVLRGIVGQQLSGAAAASIFERLREQVGVSPAAIASASDDALLAAGLSRRKVEYVRSLAQAVASGDLDLEALDSCTDDEVIAKLTAQRGIGTWTAHMFLLFAMRRPDVIAPGDLGIRQAVGRLLELGRAATPEEVEQAAEKWRPHRSAATFYLYREAGMASRAKNAAEGIQTGQ
jgi:DNA-3-methyladenine glycosylase II